jgi:potassium-transporting ATPase KdpC subunit
MLRRAASSAAAAIVLTAILGFAYPGALTAFAQLAFPNKADGSLVQAEGRPVGSRLAAQAFTGPEYFHPRPSATDYDAAGTSFSNLGPTNPELAALVERRVEAILKLERPYNPGLERSDIPVDAVTASGSGIDPDISPAYARLEASRVAAERGLPPATVEQLIGAATDARWLGLFGEPGVNVLELNLLLDRTTR